MVVDAATVGEHGYAAESRLRDGDRIRFRAIRPEDRQDLVEAFRRLSPESIYFRFMEPKKGLTPSDLDSVTSFDPDDHVALVAETVAEDGSRELVGVGEYFASPSRGEGDRSAEVAFTVLDEHQGRGIGTLLLHHLQRIATRRGIDRFEAYVLPDNRRMLRVFEHSGYLGRERFEDGLIRVDLRLGDPWDSVSPG